MGNIFGRWEGTRKETVLTGSHCDAIPLAGARAAAQAAVGRGLRHTGSGGGVTGSGRWPPSEHAHPPCARQACTTARWA